MLKSRLPHARPDGPEPGGAASAGRPPFDAYAALAATLDAQALEGLRSLDPQGRQGLLPRLLRTFDHSLEEASTRLPELLARGDSEALGGLGHKLKSSAGALGARELARICTEIERRVRAHETGGLGPLVDDLLAETGRIRAALAAVLAHCP